MLRDTDVPTMMLRVEATLDAAARSPNGASGVMRVASEGDRHLNVGKARQLAGIELEFPAGSDRALVGKAVGFAKRALRRALRWYVTPMIHQQTRFNHAAVDLFEGLRLSVDRLARRIDALQPASVAADGGLLPGCRTVAVVGDVRVPARLDADGADARRLDADGLMALEPASVEGVVVATGELDGTAVAAIVEAALAALAPGGKLVVLTTEAAPIPAAAVAWAASAAGFVQVRQAAVDPAPVPPVDGQPLAAQLDEVARRLSEPRTVAVLAVRPRVNR